MFWPAISVSIAAACDGCAVLSAVVKLKMLVSAGVVRCSLISTSHIGLKPSATLSLLSATPSTCPRAPTIRTIRCTSSRMCHWVNPADSATDFVSTLKVLETGCGTPPTHRHERIAHYRVLERDGCECVAEAFAERDADVELVAETVRTADIVGAREVELDVVAEFVGDDVLIELVGIICRVRRSTIFCPPVPPLWKKVSPASLSDAQSSSSAGKFVAGATPTIVCKAV